MIKKVLLISALVLGTFSLSLARENKVASIIPYPNDVQMGEGFFNAAGAAVVDGTTYFLLANDIDMAPISADLSVRLLEPCLSRLAARRLI